MAQAEDQALFMRIAARESYKELVDFVTENFAKLSEQTKDPRLAAEVLVSEITSEVAAETAAETAAEAVAQIGVETASRSK